MKGRFINLDPLKLLQDMLAKKRFRFMTEPEGKVIMVKIDEIRIGFAPKGCFEISCELKGGEYDDGILNLKDTSVTETPGGGAACFCTND